MNSASILGRATMEFLRLPECDRAIPFGSGRRSRVFIAKISNVEQVAKNFGAVMQEAIFKVIATFL
ncbi:hypothetical protein V2H45_06375 [Tumidithrix elongata RA019]|uniref:Uncharacterized protein n=1 Tax=Tumidithrix elongata BACA0141 TaxID=2716417 RepID=A0AAW9PYN5_9CYAN|nr:hypothetical protein [Tumidithrix elongata RA019]